MTDDLRAKIEARKKEREKEEQNAKALEHENKLNRLEELRVKSRELQSKSLSMADGEPEDATSDQAATLKAIQKEITQLETETLPLWRSVLSGIAFIVFALFGVVGFIGLFIDASNAVMPLFVSLVALIFAVLLANNPDKERDGNFYRRQNLNSDRE